MKKSFVLITAVMLLFGAFAFGDEATIIDFTLLDADIVADQDGNPTENSRTTMDYSVTAGMTFTNDQKSLMRSSLALPNWEVVLNSSSQSVKSLALSQVKYAPVKDSASVPFAGSNVMGVRIEFPVWANNANAMIVPAFEIPAYEPMAARDENGIPQEPTAEEAASGKTQFEEGYGVVKNVGTIKALSVTTLGMNFPHKLYVHLKDTDGIERRYLMGELGFDGWKELRWNNPSYITDIRTREIRVYPVYPRGLPYIKFVGFEIARDAMHNGDTFVGYFKDVKVIYDKAILNTDRDIADEDLWGIITTKESEKQNAEMTRFGEKQVIRFLEKEKQAQEEAFTSSLSVEGTNDSAAVGGSADAGEK
ncbi:MAG: flagellar filament outer layer protein FlaA [Spirochaetaceae bacterium]|nr:flagellar filament outer layer protein FlaA [Spirochaetaceae bacterium]